MNKKIFLLAITLFLVGCNTNPPASSSSSSSSSSSESSSSSSSESSSSSSSSTSSLSSSSSSDDVQDLGKRTIKEVIDLISKKNWTLNQSGIAVDLTSKVTVEAYALSKIDLVKSTKNFGLDVSNCYKVILGDATGIIGAASPNTKNGNSLYGKVGDYAGQSTSKYVVTGYLSMYLGQPELYVPGRTFTWNQDLDISCDITSFSHEISSLSYLYDQAKNMNYNCRGHGYLSTPVTIKGLTCLYKANDSSSYYFGDGTTLLRVLKERVSFTPGRVYDLTGILTMNSYRPALRALESNDVSDTNNATYTDLNNAVNLPVSSLRSYAPRNEDTDNRPDSFVDLFKHVYKDTVYMNYVEENGKLYFGMTNESLAGVSLTGRDYCGANYNFTFIDNENFWNVDESTATQYNPYVYNDLVNDSTKPVEVYYYIQQVNHSNNKAYYKVILLEETFPGDN
ncbi:MAG: hypothetical protein SO176_04040 [Bacilli bacterium]|nr:hypothetical protein [Bacilli bacterium]